MPDPLVITAVEFAAHKQLWQDQIAIVTGKLATMEAFVDESKQQVREARTFAENAHQTMRNPQIVKVENFSDLMQESFDGKGAEDAEDFFRKYKSWVKFHIANLGNNHEQVDALSHCLGKDAQKWFESANTVDPQTHIREIPDLAVLEKLFLAKYRIKLTYKQLSAEIDALIYIPAQPCLNLINRYELLANRLGWDQAKQVRKFLLKLPHSAKTFVVSKGIIDMTELTRNLNIYQELVETDSTGTALHNAMLALPKSILRDTAYDTSVKTDNDAQNEHQQNSNVLVLDNRSRRDQYRSPDRRDQYRSQDYRYQYRSPEKQIDPPRIPYQSRPQYYRNLADIDDQYRSQEKSDQYRSPWNRYRYRPNSTRDQYRPQDRRDQYRSPERYRSSNKPRYDDSPGKFQRNGNNIQFQRLNQRNRSNSPFRRNTNTRKRPFSGDRNDNQRESPPRNTYYRGSGRSKNTSANEQFSDRYKSPERRQTQGDNYTGSKAYRGKNTEYSKPLGAQSQMTRGTRGKSRTMMPKVTFRQDPPAPEYKVNPIPTNITSYTTTEGVSYSRVEQEAEEKPLPPPF